MDAQTNAGKSRTSRLKSCINDLISTVSLPAVWSGMPVPGLANAALELLIGMLRLDFAFVLLDAWEGDDAITVTRFARGANEAALRDGIEDDLKAWLIDNRMGASPAVFKSRSGASFSLGACRLGFQDDIGWLVAASAGPRFPDATERLLISVIGNQLVIGVQETRMRTRQSRIADALETTVAQRTLELQTLNEALSAQVEAYNQAQEKLRANQFFLTQGQRLSQTGSFGLNVETGEQSWSDETYRIWELDPTARPSYDYMRQRVHPADAAFFEEIIRQRGRDGADLEFEIRLLTRSGAIKYVRLIRRAIFDDAGRLSRFYGAIQDITVEKQASQRILELQDRLQRENVVLREQIDETSMFEEIVGTSPAMQHVLSRLSKVAPTDTTVLITGDTGTGKELIARAIHKRSRRATGSFVPVNCAAIPGALIGSELFGHEKGAFTGALQRRLGRFEIAEGGTLFLDEVGELPAETQVALLRVLQEREFERVGGSQSLRSDVRVIAATNRDLAAAVAAGKFREDLFYRLNVFPLEMPPLRSRLEDIPMLTEYFITRYATKLGKRIRSIDPRCVELFQSYPWPGNIRELQNVIERSLIVCETDVFSVDQSWLVPDSVHGLQAAPSPSNSPRRTERALIESALAASHGRVSGPSGAAMRLGMPSSTLESKIRTLRINKHQYRPR